MREKELRTLTGSSLSSLSSNNNFLKGSSSMVEHLPNCRQEVGGSIPPCPIINL